MTKNTLLTITVILLVMMNIAIVSFFILTKPNRHNLHGEGPKQQIIEDLHFDKQQIAAYELLIQEHRTAIVALEREMNSAKNTLYSSLSTNDTTNEYKLIADIANIQSQMERVHYAHFLAIKKLCHQNQLNDFNKLSQKLASYFAPKRPQHRP